MNDLKPLSPGKKQLPILKVLKKLWFLPIIILILVIFIRWDHTNSSLVFNYVLGNKSSLKTVDGKVNILLVGIAGGNHDGPNLTDTIMVASYDTKTKKVDLISLPRDLWLTKYQVKVNALYQVGINKGNGLDFARQGIGEVLGLEIPYAVRVDFSGFVKAVDLVSGLEVKVANSFDDYVYPVPGKEDELCQYQESEKDIDEDQAKSLGIKPGKVKVLLDKTENIATASAGPSEPLIYTDNQVIQFFSCRFEHLKFKKGKILMDGETALKFVRSRHGNNGEGSDFARSKRQQLVLQAFKEKVISFDTLTDIGKIVGLLKTFGDSIDTNITQNQYLEFAELARKVDGVKTYSIDESGDNPLLITPPQKDFGGAWVLIPPKEDFTIIHQYVANIISGALDASGSAKIIPAK